MVNILNKIVKNGELNSKNFNLALNTKLCKQRLSYTFYSLQLEALETYLIGFFKSTSLKLGSLNQKLYVDIKNGLNLENPVHFYHGLGNFLFRLYSPSN